VVEKVMVVVFDTPNVAVPVGTSAGDQLVAVSKSPDVGLRSQVAFCAGAANGPSSAAKSPTNTARLRIRALPLLDR
jgi:hypothetical protein